MNAIFAFSRSSATAALFLLVSAPALPSSLPHDAGSTPMPAQGGGRSAHASATYGNLPLSFEANHGQTDARVRYLTRGSGYTLFLTSTAAVLSVQQYSAGGDSGRDTASDERPQPTAETVFKMELVGADYESRTEGSGKLPGSSNYFIGDDPGAWHTGIPSYTHVRYRQIYPGIDLVYYGNQRQLEYDFIVAPGADPGLIELAFEGVQDRRLDGNGDLVLRVAGGEVRQRAPLIYQRVDGIRKLVAGRYLLRGKDRVGFEIADYDDDAPLIIDPVLVYATYLGGSGVDIAHDVAVDAAGNAYVTGYTRSSNFPTSVPRW